MKRDLTRDQIEHLLDLLRTELAGVQSGEISGYGQRQSDEVADIQELILDLEG